MHFSKNLSIIFSLILLLLLLPACSSSSPSGNDVIQPTSNFGHVSDTGRNILGIWNASIDIVNETFTIEPVSRNSAYHYPLSNLYPNAVSLVDYSFGDPFTADIRLTHPLPGSGIDAYDPRVIAMLPANPGVSMHFPASDVIANNSAVMEPDGYSKFYDNSSLPGNANPFIAYFKDQPNRVWSSTAVTEETKTWNIDLAGFGGTIEFSLVLDVSTHFPQPPQPIIDNCPEPYSIGNFIINGLLASGVPTEIRVSVFDWQGESDLDVSVEMPEIYTGTVTLNYLEPGTEPNEHIFANSVSNDLNHCGPFNSLISATDTITGAAIYQEFSDVAINPQLLSSLDIDYLTSLCYADGYAYVITFGASYVELNVVDVSDPENPVIINSCGEYDSYVPYNCAYSEGYVYVCTTMQMSQSDGNIHIFNVNDPQNPTLTKTIWESHGITSIALDGDYGYITLCHKGLGVLDISSPPDTEIVYTLDLLPSDTAWDICVEGDYAYVTSQAFSEGGFNIIDISTPESAYIVSGTEIVTSQYPPRISIYNGYAYCTAEGDGFIVIDIDPPETPQIVNTIDIGRTYNLDIYDGYLYVSKDYTFGRQVYNLDDPVNPLFLGICDNWRGNILFADGYTFSIYQDFKIFDYY